MSGGPWRRVVPVAAAVVTVLASAVAGVAVVTAPERRSVRTYTELIAAANRQDVETARGLCSARYLRTHDLRPADEGGIVGLPRNIHPNFKSWRAGPNVHLCPTNRVGPVYQFVPTPHGWRFDGPVGLLRARGQFVPWDDGLDSPVHDD